MSCNKQPVASEVIEASSNGIAEHRLDGTRIRTAVFTNFTQDHLDYHGSMQAYWAAKRRLFDWAGLASAVINIDDAQGALLATELAGKGLDLWTCSRRQDARLRAWPLPCREGLSFELREGDTLCRVDTALAGDYNIVPTPQDIYPTTSYAANALVQPESREAFARLVAQAGGFGGFGCRLLAGHVPGRAGDGRALVRQVGRELDVAQLVAAGQRQVGLGALRAAAHADLEQDQDRQVSGRGQMAGSQDG